MKTGSLDARVRPGLVLLLTLLGFGTALVAPSLAAAPSASVEVVGDLTPELRSAPLEAKLGDEEGVASLVVPLLVNMGGELEVDFVDSADPAKPDEATTWMRSEEEVDLKAGAIYLLRLAFVPPPDRDEFEGVLSIRTKGNVPLVREVKGSTAAASSASSSWTPTQKKIEISAERALPFTETPDAARNVGLIGPEPTAGSEAEVIAEGEVTLSDSGNGTVKLEAPRPQGEGAEAEEGEEGTVRRADLTLSEAGGVGTASTILKLGTAEKPQELEVVVEVGDSLIFPLIVIFLGALLGKVLPAFWDVKREGWMLQAKLKEAVDDYRKAVEEPPPLSLGLKDLEDEVGSTKDWEAPSGDLANPENKNGAALYYRLGRAASTEALEREVEEASGLIDRIEGWISVRKALFSLATALKAVEEKSAAGDLAGASSRPLLDSGDLLAREIEIDSDLARSAKLAKAIASQEEALKLYWECKKLEAGLDLADRESWPLPEGIYLGAKPPLRRSEEEAEAMLEQLRELLHWLRSATARSKSLDVERVLEILGTQRLLRAGGQLDEDVAALRREEIEDLGWKDVEVKAPPALAGAPTPAQIMASVRGGDWFIAALTFLLTALAYLLGVFDDGPFGTLYDYLALFAAGAGTQVALNTAVLPLFRSYKAGGKKPDAKAATPAAKPAAAEAEA